MVGRRAAFPIYGIGERLPWRLSSFLFLVLIRAAIVLPLRSPEARREFLDLQRAHRIASAFFWSILEVSIQLPLVFNLGAFRPDLAPAFRTTAPAIDLVEAAFLLAALALIDRDTA